MDPWNCILRFLSAWISTYFLSTIFLKSHSKSFPKNLPPGPHPLTVITNLLSFKRKPHRLLAKLAKVYGPVMTIKLGSKTTVVVSSASMCKQVLQKQDAYFSGRNPLIGMSILGNDKASMAFSPPDAHWRELRRICKSYVFAGSRLASSRGLRGEKLQQLLSHVEDCCEAGTAVNIGRAVFTATLNFLSNTFLSIDLADHTSDTAREFWELILTMLEIAGTPNIADYFPSLKTIDPQGIGRRTTTLAQKVMKVFDDVITQRVQSRKAAGCIQDNDVLDVLLNICQEKNSELKQSDIPHVLLEVFIAGTDTTSGTVEWALAELLHSPEKLKKAKTELEEVIGKGKQVEEDDIVRLPYLQAVVKETLRMHPPVPFLVPRKVLAEVELSGYTVPNNAVVLVNIWAVGRDENLWTNANAFEPERFIGSHIDVKGQDFELIPFGSGRRMCPGLPLGHRMIHCLLGALIHSFNWKLEDGITPKNMDIDDKFGFTLTKAQALLAIPIHL